jgi:glycosyltransferase involved in cell wall biosynthesis
VVETERPGILTEHGIYTNERRIEIAMATWLTDYRTSSLDIENRRRDLRDVWTGAFVSYSRVCYAACSRIITLYSGNQVLQIRDGAPVERMAIIPNGVDYKAFAAIARDQDPRPPTVALIGRVVPIKDVKTFIKAAAILRNLVPQVRALVMGPTDEEPAYYMECERMVAHLGLGETVVFTGPVNLKQYLGRIDIIALTSISEAQPLALLEGGAAGIPCVATDVGSCRDIIEGRVGEDPSFGRGGAVVPLADAEACARAMADLLLDDELHDRCARAIQRRVEAHYNKVTVDEIYRRLYETYMGTAPDVEPAVT